MNAEEAESSATVPVAAGGVARERRNILTTSARRTRCGRGRPVPVPEGRRRKLAGGKAAPADAAPGNRAAWLRAPTGHRRKWPEATRGGGNVAGRTPPKTSSMPRWGMDHLAAQPGAAPATRACPRLISCGVPPGRRAKRWRQFIGRRPAASAAAKSQRAARIFRGARLCARSTSRSGLVARDASKSNGCVRSFGAAAAGPRRTQPRSLGCGPAALYYNPPKSSRGARIPERGRPARSSCALAKAQQIANAPAPLLPLRPGRPRSLGCGRAALFSSRFCGPIQPPCRAGTA